MTPRAGVLLFVVGMIVLAAGYALGPASVATERAAFAQGTPLFPGVAATLQQATAIDITARGKHFELRRESTAPDAAWGLVQRDGYPVQPSLVHELLTGLAELRLDEPRTSDPALYSRLGLGDAGKPDSEATDLRVLGPDGKTLVALQIGHRQPRKGGGETLYVRRGDEARTWLAEGSLKLDPDAQAWLQRDVVNIDASKVTDITVKHGAETLVLHREGDALKVTQPTPPPPVDETKVSETARALELLMFEDVRRADTAAPVLSTTVYRTADGLSLTATQVGDAKAPWTRFSATGTGAEALQRLAGWDFLLGSFKDRLIAPTSETLKPPPTPVTTPGGQLPGLVSPGAPAPPTPTPTPGDK